MNRRYYSDIRRLETFEDRFDYLSLGGTIGYATFGFDRYLNQKFYSSREWKDTRDLVIRRDEGCDLGILGYEVHSRILIHHINPLLPSDITHGHGWILDPEFLITTCHDTHNAIHYGDKGLLKREFVERQPGDTTLW